MRYFLLLFALCLSISQTSLGQTPPQGPQPPTQHLLELNTVMMESTFEIQSLPVPGQPSSLGTVFIVGRPAAPSPGTTQPVWVNYVLITAAHVLDGIPGDTALLNLRRATGRDTWTKVPFPLQIRRNGTPMWFKHPNADVAVMYVSLPQDVTISLVTTNLLADDDLLRKFEIHPGDTLLCLGYPFGLESSVAGFPILRSGKIASFPLTPTAQTKTFLFDFTVFGGNSGGPVYMVETSRIYGGALHMGETLAFIAGLVTQESTMSEQLSGQYSAEIHRIPLNLATVVHASFIKEAIEMLPPPSGPPPGTVPPMPGPQ
jgi:hypothetical protein